MSVAPTCSVIVPVFDERDSIETLIVQITEAFEPLAESYEVIVVDDGSRDGTWESILAAASSHDHVKAIRLRGNFGKASALAAGVDLAQGDIVITMDGDLQDDPAEIPRFLEALDGKDRLVSGWKVERLDPLSKRLPSKLFNAVTSTMSGVKMHDHNCGFKAAPVELYRSIPLYGELHRYIPALANDLGYEVMEIPVNHRPREFGRSKFGFERYLRGLLDLMTVMMITRYRRRPGHLLGGFGVLLGSIGTAILLYLAAVWVFTDDAIGTRPLLAFGVLLVLVSIQFLSFGVVAELVVNSAERRSHPELVAERVHP